MAAAQEVFAGVDHVASVAAIHVPLQRTLCMLLALDAEVQHDWVSNLLQHGNAVPKDHVTKQTRSSSHPWERHHEM